jgi:hypothetical protein
MNHDLAERLQQAFHVILPLDTIPLNAIRFLHWSPGNENAWSGLEQCLIEYMADSLCSRFREPVMFFGLHSNTDIFPTNYKELFSLGAGYMPYDAGTDAVLNEWRRASGDIHKPFPETLKDPYLRSLLKLLGEIMHLFDNRLDSIQGRICVLRQGRERDASFFNPRSQYTEKQQAMMNRLQQYDVFLSKIECGDGSGDALLKTLREFDAAWNHLNAASEAACGLEQTCIKHVLDALIKVSEILQDAMNCIKKIKKGICDHIYGGS